MSQCDRILEVLRDGRPHRMEEIHQRVGFCRLNSRIAELRSKRHLNIVCDKTDHEYVYQLLPLEEGAVAEPIGAGRLAPSSSESGVGKLAGSGSGVPSSLTQLVPATGPDALGTRSPSGSVPERRSRPLGGGKADDRSGEKPSGEPGRASHGDAAKQALPPPSGVQLTVWEGMAA